MSTKILINLYFFVVWNIIFDNYFPSNSQITFEIMN
jgi:hypothetical protein